MKVLYVLGNYPKISESYISAELKYMKKSGIELGVWSQRVGSPEVVPLVPPTPGTLTEALHSFDPDIVHVHYISTHDSLFQVIEDYGKPVTVRGHSFDFSPERVKELVGRKYIRKIYLFPHMTDFCIFPKVVSLPVAFDSSLHMPYNKKDKKLVLRSGAGKKGKGLEMFFQVPELCPSFRFALVANVVWGEESYMGFLRQKTMAAKGKLNFFEDLPNIESAMMTQEAGIYLDTSDHESHPFGMPISIAESMATGSYILALDRRGAKSYLGNAGMLYKNVLEAARVINSTLLWSEDNWQQARDRSIFQSKRFMDFNVLPRVIEDWEAM